MNKPTSDDKKEPAFKVVDKRRFDDEGREKEAAPQEQGAPSPKAQETEPTKSPAHEADEESARGSVNFGMFVQSLAHQVMMGLGIVPWPDTKLVRRDLSLARETIDLLLVLKTKTAGNLDKEEEALLNGLLYQLQVAFVEISKESGGPSGGGSIIT